MPDDALERIARNMAEEGCSRCFGDDSEERCCMTDNARRVVAVVLSEIDKCGIAAGAYTGVLEIFARRNGIEYERAPRPTISSRTTQ